MFNLQQIVKQIDEEADRRYKRDSVCSGGKVAKLHSVLMEIGLEVGKLMLAEELKKVMVV